MEDQERKTIFNFFRKNPFASPKEISEKTGVEYSDLLVEMDTNKDFRKSIESIRDVQSGIIGL